MNLSTLRKPWLFTKPCIFIYVLAAFTLLSSEARSQKLKFLTPNPLNTLKEATNKKVKIAFYLKNGTEDKKVTYTIDQKNSSATKADYSLPDGEVVLKSDEQFRGQIAIEIKSKASNESRHDVIILFSFIDGKGKTRNKKFRVNILEATNRKPGDPQLTASEEEKNRHVGIDFYTGGSLDFYNSLKFQKLSGELIVHANDITGFQDRFGGFLGIANFQNFQRDSSNLRQRDQYIRIDTGAYLPGKTPYKRNAFIDHQKIHTSQWSYYVNPTMRLNRMRSDFFNIYASLRMEALVVTTTRSYDTDTILSDTSTVALQNPVFQSGEGSLVQNLSDTQTSGYFSIGFPMFLNATDKVKVYFDPNIGMANYNLATYKFDEETNRLQRQIQSDTRTFYLFRARISEQFSGLSVTIGGEVRGFLKDYAPTINAYLGIKANIAGLLSKENR